MRFYKGKLHFNIAIAVVNEKILEIDLWGWERACGENHTTLFPGFELPVFYISGFGIAIFLRAAAGCDWSIIAKIK